MQEVSKTTLWLKVTGSDFRKHLQLPHFYLSFSVVDVENNVCSLHFISNLMMLSKQMGTFVSMCPTFSGDCNPSKYSPEEEDVFVRSWI